jgi:hypothetical protein
MSKRKFLEMGLIKSHARYKLECHYEIKLLDNPKLVLDSAEIIKLDSSRLIVKLMEILQIKIIQEI